MIKWIKKLMSWDDHKPAFLATEYHPEVEAGYAEIDISAKAVKGISEPVISIVNSFKEKGRWKVTAKSYSAAISNLNHYGNNDNFTVVDTVTGERYTLRTRYTHYLGCKISFPSDVISYSLPTWMTDKEKQYVLTAFNSICDKIEERFIVIKDRKRGKHEKQARVNQDKERNRLKALYCKE